MTITTAELQKDSHPRLTPIENPDSIKLKLAYWFTKRKVGKVITPLKVLYARFPQALGLSKELMDLDQFFTISSRLKHLIKVYVATLNGCAFCIDIGKASAKTKDIDSSIFDDLMQFDESESFTAAEKSALSYVDEATRNKHVSDSTFNRLKQHFDEQEIVQITLINAIENYYNLMNAPMNISSDELCELLS
ncbi:carboxymuconolactone decarboxylase family protein [Aliifodinibius sp. S!AR15-10]|uniref:carboxymuconolactone decarboxylase family protein n=1 Tax=Aliifodinibius sp. S!AR15-10 TaxID=2950437 RepID=UPI002862859D|nr:carboxymuconolactone decarboxylase family protein [Aliifodinibius sp. S!AR15-10]MDR8390351.1 carboxymuconolactone decarboxylase family protein [Aliifodinibius sp. S!AR15-10]